MADDELAIKYLEEAAAQAIADPLMTIAEALTIGGVGYEVDYPAGQVLVLDELKSGNVEAGYNYS